MLINDSSPTSRDESLLEHAANLRKRLELAYQQARAWMSCQLDRQKEFYVRRVHGQPYKTGNWVWLHSPVVPRGSAEKQTMDPFKVLRCISDGTYSLQDAWLGCRKMIVHFDRLKPCKSVM